MATHIGPARFARRVAFAFLCAIGLWCIVTLGEEYEQTIELPLRVELPEGIALARRIPQSVRVVVRASGWSFLRFAISSPRGLVVQPWMSDLDSSGTIDVSEEQIAQYVKNALPDVQRRAYAPSSMRLNVEPTATRRVPLVALASVQPRDGFGVSGVVRLNPDSVTITGAKSVIESINEWPTDTATFADIHGPFSQWLQVGNPYEGMVDARPSRVEITSDVQQIAEIELPDVPLFERMTTRDTSLHLTLVPQRVRVLVRGGVRDLERLDPSSIRAYIEVIEGVDTGGVAIPRFILPPDLHLNVVAVSPERIRYRYQRRG